MKTNVQGWFREGDPIQPDELRIGHVFSKKGMTDSFTVLDTGTSYTEGDTLLIQGDDEPVWQARVDHTNVRSDKTQPREPGIQEATIDALQDGADADQAIQTVTRARSRRNATVTWRWPNGQYSVLAISPIGGCSEVANG